MDNYEIQIFNLFLRNLKLIHRNQNYNQPYLNLQYLYLNNQLNQKLLNSLVFVTQHY